MDEPELNSIERDLLRRAVTPDVPPDFADAVLDAIDDSEAVAAPTPGRRWLGREHPDWAVAGSAVALAAALVLLVASGLVRPEAPDAAGLAQTSLQRTTETLQEHCGGCHDGERSSAPADALVALDLRDPAWVNRMSDEKLKALADRVDMDDDVDAAERKRVRTFVQAELEARRG